MIDDKLILDLKNWFLKQEGTITAFSGGIDSALVLFLSRKFLGHNRAIGVISNSESLKEKDYQLAIEFAKKNNILLRTIYTEELTDSNYNTNPVNRCYFCKSHLYDSLKEIQKEYPNYVVLNGTNKDDFSDYRPGLKAADENMVRSPLADLNIGKVQIRALAKYFEIPFWNKPASPCLSSRIPYGNRVTSEKLSQIEKAESILNVAGFEDVRIRHFDNLCKIEVPKTQINLLKEKFPFLETKIKDLGFTRCSIDKEGLVSGKLNKLVSI